MVRRERLSQNYQLCRSAASARHGNFKPNAATQLSVELKEPGVNSLKSSKRGETVMAAWPCMQSVNNTVTRRCTGWHCSERQVPWSDCVCINMMVSDWRGFGTREKAEAMKHPRSIAFRHLPPKEGCRKPVLGVWTRLAGFEHNLSGWHLCRELKTRHRLVWIRLTFDRQEIVNDSISFIIFF